MHALERLYTTATVLRCMELVFSYPFYDLPWQNFIICIEMLVAALAHYFIFSHKPYVDRAAAQVPCVTSCLRMLDIRDIYGDVKEHFVDPIPRPKIPMLRLKRRKQTEVGEREEGEEEEVEVTERESELVPLLNGEQQQQAGDNSFSLMSYGELGNGTRNRKTRYSSRSSSSVNMYVGTDSGDMVDRSRDANDGGGSDSCESVGVDDTGGTSTSDSEIGKHGTDCSGHEIVVETSGRDRVTSPVGMVPCPEGSCVGKDGWKDV